VRERPGVSGAVVRHVFPEEHDVGLQGSAAALAGRDAEPGRFPFRQIGIAVGCQFGGVRAGDAIAKGRWGVREDRDGRMIQNARTRDSRAIGQGGRG